MPRPQNFVSAFVDINVCPPPFFGKIFTKSTDKNRVGPPPLHYNRSCIEQCNIQLKDKSRLRLIVAESQQAFLEQNLAHVLQ